MNLINRIKAGAKEAPAFTIALYFLSRILDNYTTYLASPDLIFEGNWFIRYYNLTWGQIILKDLLITLFLTLALLIALAYIHRYYRENLTLSYSFMVELFKQQKLLLCTIILCSFYTNLFYSLFLIINNYLQYIYIFKIDNTITTLSHNYVDRVIMKYPLIFIWYRTFFIVFALGLTLFKVNRIRNKYRSESA
jgi:hypothetical protein